jgi:phenylalanyl-tRNA synthetase beta chain
MKISAAWLSRYIQHGLSVSETSQLLTDCGLEVESVEPYESIKGGLRGVVVGEVLTCIQHPNADRLRLTTVNVGSDSPLSIVCGAPNVAAGQKVLVATIGTQIYPKQGEPFAIKESKIRGELSQGMICAEDELGLGDSHDGIMILPDNIAVGTTAADYFSVESDHVFEIGLTPNRIDAASHFGVARDLAAVCYQTHPNLVAQKPLVNLQWPAVSHSIAINIAATEALSRYSTLKIDGIRNTESPAWLRNALLSIGLRPINAVVDASNFVLHELGQPLHTFDAAKICGKEINVRVCAEGTPFTALDGSECKLTSNDLMICDAERPLCLAGIYGGLDSGVNIETTSVLIESANFNSVWVRKSSKRHNLKTDSSFRFERGADPEICVFAMLRTAELIMELCGGTIEGASDYYPTPAQPIALHYSWAHMDRLIGESIPREEATNILHKLGIEVIKQTETGVDLSIPPFKTGVEHAADITEEILRIYGYNRINIPTQVRNSVSTAPNPDEGRLLGRISEHLCGLGFMEVLNNSLSASVYASEGKTPVKLANPLSSELDVLRTSLLPAMLENVAWNKNRQQNNLKFFEFGKTYEKKERGFAEQSMLAMLVCGNISSEVWNTAERKVDFYYLKGAAMHLLGLIGIEAFDCTFEEIQQADMQTCFAIIHRKTQLGIVGQVAQQSGRKFGLDDAVFYAAFDWQKLVSIYAAIKTEYREVPRFPSVRRDLSLLIDKHITFEQIRLSAAQAERKLLREINLFDVYEGDKLPEGKKSYAVSFLFCDEAQTLNDKTIEKSMERITRSLAEATGAELRS